MTMMMTMALLLAVVLRSFLAASLMIRSSGAWQVPDVVAPTTRLSSFRLDMIAPQQLGSFEMLDVSSSTNDRRILWEDWTTNEDDSTAARRVNFTTAWDIQKDYLQQHMDRLGKSIKMEGSAESSFLMHDDSGYKDRGIDRVVMLEHEPVYTLGTASDPSFVLEQQAMSKIPVLRMDRGGEVTYHGPGQLTVYPVIDLRNYRQDIHWYVRALEEAVLVALQICWKKHGGTAEIARDDDFTGVWIRNHGKIAAVGVKCRRWVTQHGVAINVEARSLPPFRGIVPCGLTGPKARVTCVNDLVERPVTVSQMAAYMKEAMEKVFAIQLVPPGSTTET